MRKIALVIAVAASVAAVLIPVSQARPSKGSTASVRIWQSKLGQILVDGRGRSLYLFEKDKRGKSSCNGGCASAWPPLIAASTPRAGAGVKASLLGRTKRRDGRWQVTYNRHPLYTFFQDTKKGQTNGEGLDDFGAHWYAVSPAGTPIANSSTSNQASSGNQSSNSSPGNYGY
jgi:predicted lipoprotein with Yx(FWY)xxD motif